VAILDENSVAVARNTTDPSTADVPGNQPGGTAAGYELFWNQPNPFHATTMIRYAVPQETDVHLAVFDARGRLTRVLADGAAGPGVTGVVWDGRDGQGRSVPSGIYFYRLEAGSFVQQRGMTVLR
jgi:hypothetical protein